jgi:type II secretory pathway pseudopilin PulG
MRRSRRAFTLVEALFAIVLFFMALGTFLSLLPLSLQSNAHDGYYLQAVAAGQEYLDALRSSVENGTAAPAPPAVAINAGYSVMGGNNPNVSPGDFTIGGNCQLVNGSPTLQECTVTVTWPEYGQPRSYTVSSYATPQVS